MRTQLDMLETFHRVFGAHVEDQPTADIPADTIELRCRLIQEELNEYRQAADDRDLVGVADALSDLLYVVLGTFVSHGLQSVAEELFDEVHASNMSKLDAEGKPIHREDGKVLKSDRFREPDLASILARAVCRKSSGQVWSGGPQEDRLGTASVEQ
jgi:predicted HAD superfamily Cof-like phosphohydrolase